MQFDPTKPVVTLTDAAALHVRQLMEQEIGSLHFFCQRGVFSSFHLRVYHERNLDLSIYLYQFPQP